MEVTAGKCNGETPEELKLLVRKAFDDSDGTYGHRRVWAQLARWGVRAGLELVRALMRQLGLVACQPRPWRPATTQQGQAGPVPDLVNRDFTAAARGRNGRRHHVHPDVGGMAFPCHCH